MSDGAMRPERPGDQATADRLPPASEGRLARSWRLTRQSWKLVRSDRALVLLATASMLATVAAAAVIFGAVFAVAHDSVHGRGFGLLVALVESWPLTFISTYFGVALAAAAAEALEGWRLAPRDALRVANGRLGQIALWSLVAAGVGLLLRQIAERVPFGGRIATWLAGLAWSLATFFVVPILALEGCSAFTCVRRSSSVIRKRWGEGVAGSAGIGAIWFALAIVPVVLLFMVAGAVGGGVAIAAVVLGLLTFLAAAVLGSATRQVYAVALYRYATAGQVPDGWREPDLAQPFTRRRRGLFFRGR